MNIIAELRSEFNRFSAMIHEDGHADILSMPYAEYSLQCFIIYEKVLYNDFLHEGSNLAQCFRSIGIDEPRDHLIFFIDTFYLFLRTQDEQIN